MSINRYTVPVFRPRIARIVHVLRTGHIICSQQENLRHACRAGKGAGPWGMPGNRDQGLPTPDRRGGDLPVSRARRCQSRCGFPGHATRLRRPKGKARLVLCGARRCICPEGAKGEATGPRRGTTGGPHRENVPRGAKKRSPTGAAVWLHPERLAKRRFDGCGRHARVHREEPLAGVVTNRRGKASTPTGRSGAMTTARQERPGPSLRPPEDNGYRLARRLRQGRRPSR